MSPQVRKLLALTLGIVAGNVVAERFILRVSDDDPTGFVTVREGIGVDEFVRAGVAVAGSMVFDNLLRRIF